MPYIGTDSGGSASDQSSPPAQCESRRPGTTPTLVPRVIWSPTTPSPSRKHLPTYRVRVGREHGSNFVNPPTSSIKRVLIILHPGPNRQIAALEDPVSPCHTYIHTTYPYIL
jgi:hypothetical protein